MKIHLRTILLKEVLAKIPNDDIQSKIRYQSDNDRVTLEIEDIEDNFLDGVRKWLEKSKLNSAHDRQAVTVLTNYDLLNEDFVGTTVTKLEHLVAAFKSYFEDSPNKWVFYTRDEDDRLVPMYVSSITYYPDEWEVKGKRRILVSPAHVTMTCSYIHRRTQLGQRFTWSRSDINRDSGTTLVTMLRKHGLAKETRVSYLNYEKEVKRYQEITPKTGAQFAGYGVSLVTSSSSAFRHNSRLQPMLRDGRPAKIVMDDAHEEGSLSRSSQHGVSPTASMYFWKKKIRKDAKDVRNDADLEDMYDSDEAQAEYEETVLPVWPYVKVFDLGLHQFCEMHVTDVHDYPWDTSAFDKLILPDDHKTLIEILVNGTNNLMEDIIAGKTGGIIVLATGKPGVGKTLTAEVYSEFIERPVYSVQCSQLGLNVESIEKNLLTTLARAQRWNALLLLDEADVYIRHRGHDLHHNAIVGVFLRILEYYRGVLFMTSNLATVIDDAVLSRATAHIRYLMPTDDMRAKLWEVLGKQYKIDFNKKDIEALVKEFSDVAGRDIKSMLKLATLMSPGKKPDLDLLKIVYTFQDTAESMTMNAAELAKAK